MNDQTLHAFQGHRDALRAFLQARNGWDYYTYLLLFPDGRPFYVGKGRGNRVLHHEAEAMRQSNLRRTNPHKCNTIRRLITSGQDLLYRIDRTYAEADQLACLEREAALIARYRRRSDGGTLTNLASGLGNLFGLDPETAARHAATLSGLPEDNPERAALNLFLASFGEVSSVPVKPLSQYRNRLVPAAPSSKALRTPSLRNCLTLIVPAVAEGLTLAPGAVLPRSFTLYPDRNEWPLQVSPPESVVAVIENGAASDILKLGLVTLVPAARPEDEGLQLTATGHAILLGTIGRPRLLEWALI
ncbi:MAG: GIY-YIG nuclease family protein [Rhodobacter sp.]|nr:GIY-YIG nuclease family protein [Rhodobacter sp.]